MAAKRSVLVRILGQEYRIRSDADEASIQRVASFVDETMAKIRERTRTVDTLDLAILASLNLANDLLAARGAAAATEGTGGVDPKRIRALIAIAESAGKDAFGPH
ncbi:MAG TPA: cell division protein ZapA [Myxococcota bacterium]|nr:cell division protein ZapA [Myxococcota bacterium]